VAILETSAAPKERTPRVGIADKPVSDACFNDWKRFCFVLREIASGENGRPLSGLEAQKRAQAVLTECGYTWPSRVQMREPIVAPTTVSPDTRASVDSQQSPAGTGVDLPVQSKNDRPTPIRPTIITAQAPTKVHRR